MIASAPTLPREFLLATACCLWPPSEERNAAIRNAATQTLDWDRFLRVVKRQRVAGLVHDGLTRACIVLPAAIAREIGDMAATIPRQNLQFAAESLRIQHLFDEAAVPALFIKGVTLGQLAYGNLGIKHSWDVDLLVTPEAVPQALQILEHVGYRGFPRMPPMTDKRYRRWISFAREYVLFHESSSVCIELHWRLTDNTYFLPGISAVSPARRVPVSGQMGIRTLDADDLFTYLCVHGAMHGWSRLKWLADVAALMAHDTISDAQRRLEVAKKVNAEHCVAQTIVLCDGLFGIQCVSVISQTLRLSIRYRWLERIALKAMTNGSAETELGDASFDRVTILMSHFMLGRGWRFAANELWQKLNGPADLLYVMLPPWLGFLYPVIRVISWIKRRGRLRSLRAPPKATPN